jgi:predicted DsbA family dithiol-disulfide isomerase
MHDMTATEQRVRIDIWSDFVCPFCYVAALNLEPLKARYPLDIRWRACELRPEGSPPISPAYRHEIETVKRPYFHRVMREQHGITVNEGPFGINSRPALVMDKYAEAQGEAQAKAFHEGVKQAYWQQAQDISDRAVLRAIAERAGLDGEAALAAIDHPQYVALVDADISEAMSLGLSAVPALVFASKYLVSGAQPTALLEQVIQRVQAET